jgi:putative oxidoreductase
LRILDRLQPLALLVMRLTLGAIMVVHGYHHLFGGMRHHAETVAGMGLPAWIAYVSAFIELVGGLLVLMGLFTRCAAFAICVEMAVILWKMLGHNGLTGDHGLESPLSMATIAFALIFFGAGPIAMDHVLRGGGGGGSNWKK